jgi:Collagen triple helix repeat (20 copies)
MFKKTKLISGGLVVAAGSLAFGGLALASSSSIPSPSGVIDSCYNRTTGEVFVISSTKACSARDTRLVWNQVGRTGAAGVNGTNGTNGANGLAGATGPQGPQGVAGAVGATGPTGPTGPAGANGAAGATGAAGSARDTGVVEPTILGGALFYPNGLTGWQAVSPLSTFSVGTYCLLPDAASTEANTTVSVSLVNDLPGVGSVSAFTGLNGTVQWDGFCPNGDVRIETRFGTALANDIAFEAIIP